MVNSDFPPNLKEGSVEQLFRQAKVFFVSELGKRLHEGGDLGFADVAALGGDMADFDGSTLAQYLARIEGRTGSDFCTRYIQFLGLEWALKRYALLEELLVKYFANQAQRHLNLLSHMPAVGTVSALALQSLATHSLFVTGPFADGFKTKWNDVTNQLSGGLSTLMKAKQLGGEDIRLSIPSALRADFGVIASLFVASAQNASTLLRYFSGHLGARQSIGPRPGDDSLLNRMSRYLDLRRHVLSDLKTQEHAAVWDLARNHIFEGRFIDFVECMSQVIEQTELLVKRLFDLESKGMTQISRADTIELECYVYVERIGVQLLALGEDTDSIVRLKNALYDYALKSRVPCLEMLDEEVQRLSTQIRKESLTRARLEVRLNDFDFPLSVAHKDWVLGLVQKHSV